MQSTVGQLSWVENLYPSSVAERMSKGLGSLSEWLKTPKEIKTTTSRVGDSDSTIPSTDRYVELKCRSVHSDSYCQFYVYSGLRLPSLFNMNLKLKLFECIILVHH